MTYTAEFTFKGAARLLAPLLRGAFDRLGTEAEIGMRRALKSTLTNRGRQTGLVNEITISCSGRNTVTGSSGVAAPK